MYYYLCNCIHSSATDVRIGLKIEGKNTWKWADESTLTTDQWRQGHPNNGKCAKSENEDNFLEWKSIKCNEELSVACFDLGL